MRRDRLTLVLLVALACAACAAEGPHVVLRARISPSIASLRPELVIDSPISGRFVREPEVEVRGRFRSYDGRAWIYVDGVLATIAGRAFVAPHVPLPEGAINLSVELTDGRGDKVRTILPLVVESPDRPRTAQRCRAGLGCLGYELRGLPRRAADGAIENAVLIWSGLGSDERLDDLWPELVGPGRALDPRRAYLIGLAGVPDVRGRRPTPASLLILLDELLLELGIGRGAALVGASTQGAELALRMLCRRGPTALTGPVLLVGGHDLAADEPVLRRLRQVVRAGRDRGDEPEARWRELASVMVPASYTPRYLADARHAADHGLLLGDEQDGLATALVERWAEAVANRVTLEAFERRLDEAFALERRPLEYPSLTGRRVLLVGNRQDQLTSIAGLRSLAGRLRQAGAEVRLDEFDDELGHSAFFRGVPIELERAIGRLLEVAP